MALITRTERYSYDEEDKNSASEAVVRILGIPVYKGTRNYQERPSEPKAVEPPVKRTRKPRAKKADVEEK